MRKHTTIILTISVFMLTFGIGIAAIGFFSGGFNIINMIGSQGMWNFDLMGSPTNDINEYSKSNTYEVSPVDVDALEIDWIAGEVEVVPYNGSSITLTEYSNNEITKGNSLRYTMDGNTLQIDYKETELAFFSFGQMDSKRLVIQIPKKLAENMAGFQFDSTSADLQVRDVSSTFFDADTASGNITTSDLQVSEVLSINTTSGDFFADQITANNLIMDTVSGDIEGETVIAREVSMNSTSGGLFVHFIRCPDSLILDSISGDTKIYLPKDSSAMVAIDSVSGDLSSDFPTKIQGEEYLIGTGRSSFDLNTTSGNVEIKMN